MKLRKPLAVGANCGRGRSERWQAGPTGAGVLLLLLPHRGSDSSYAHNKGVWCSKPECGVSCKYQPWSRARLPHHSGTGTPRWRPRQPTGFCCLGSAALPSLGACCLVCSFIEYSRSSSRKAAQKHEKIWGWSEAAMPAAAGGQAGD